MYGMVPCNTAATMKFTSSPAPPDRGRRRGEGTSTLVSFPGILGVNLEDEVAVIALKIGGSVQNAAECKTEQLHLM